MSYQSKYRNLDFSKEFTGFRCAGYVKRLSFFYWLNAVVDYCMFF